MNLIEDTNFEKARKKIREKKDVIFAGSDDELNRKVLEKERISVLLIRQKDRRDFSKQRNSGFNSVMAKAAKKNDVSIGISLDEILISRGKEKTGILARTMQNIVLCNKNKLKMKFIIENSKNQREIRDLKALGLVLGMPTWMASNVH